MACIANEGNAIVSDFSIKTAETWRVQFKNFPGVNTAWGAHLVHHKGLTTIYLRLNGIKPIQYLVEQ
ncbi:MAG: hypothetical protein ABJF11_09860 [Reichenbachiella sp.]|uniref:hypothetical protein n=1 Tax=Reichenbachiella sp. TaxID=2184521 RepID=UPI00326420A3